MAAAATSSTVVTTWKASGTIENVSISCVTTTVNCGITSPHYLSLTTFHCLIDGDASTSNTNCHTVHNHVFDAVPYCIHRRNRAIDTPAAHTDQPSLPPIHAAVVVRVV